jgi:glucose/arabinose dehydrogenase
MKTCLLWTAALLLCLAQNHYSNAQIFPPGFSAVEAATGIVNPTAMCVAPDGRIFIAQQNGALVVIKNGVKLAAPAIQLSVNSTGERGLLGIALHPSFSTNGIIYLLYTLADGSRNRVSRFWLTGDVLNPASEQLIFDLDLLSSSPYHNGGAMQFRGDKLFISTGDNSTPLNSQDLSNTHGKLLRINANGTLPGDNPFFSSTGTRQRNSIWAYGLRNPYTFDIQPGTGRILINDVGQVTWEEINDATLKGKNFGWPESEGMTSVTGHTNPLFVYPHGAGDGVGCAITGGVFFNPASTNYPTAYVGKYFFLDYCNGWINFLDVSSGATRYSFATETGNQTLGLDVGTDGNLYYLVRSGKLMKVIYDSSAGSTDPPAITDQPDDLFMAIGQSGTFQVTATGAMPISYQWKKDGENIIGANASSYTISSVQETDAGNYSVAVYNSFGNVVSEAASLTINPNSLPVVNILSPATGTTYRGGDVINFSGSASDAEDGTLPPQAYSWSVTFHHDQHFHDSPPIAVGVTSGTYTIPNSGETSINVFYRLHLTVTDSEGLSNSTYVDLKPNISVMTLQSNPTGLKLTMDGQQYTTQTPIKSVEGVIRTIGVVSPQTLNGITYSFASWTHSGADAQTLPTPIDNTTYIANFSRPLTSPWHTTDIGKVNVQGNASISSGTFSVSGSGRDIYNADDQFRYVYQAITGNCDIRARVTGMTNTNAWAKAGVMIRETLQPNSRNAFTALTVSSGITFQRRLAPGGPSSANTAAGFSPPYWVRLVRNGSTFTAYRSPDGSTWTAVGSAVTISMASTVYVGLAVTSHNSSALCTATFTNVSLTAGTSSSDFSTAEIRPSPAGGELSVYPNPVNGDVLHVQVRSQQFTPARIQVVNHLGQVVSQQDVPATEQVDAEYELDLKDRSPGFYLLRYITARRALSAGFVRE